MAERPRTEPVREELVWQLLYPEKDYWRPRVRSDCDRVQRPCPYVGCKYNLYLDAPKSDTAIHYNFPHLEPWEMSVHGSCTLDIAERGAVTLAQIGEALNLTRERIRQIEERALRRLRPLLRSKNLVDNDEPSDSTDDSESSSLRTPSTLWLGLSRRR